MLSSRKWYQISDEIWWNADGTGKRRVFELAICHSTHLNKMWYKKIGTVGTVICWYGSWWVQWVYFNVAWFGHVSYLCHTVRIHQPCPECSRMLSTCFRARCHTGSSQFVCDEKASTWIAHVKYVINMWNMWSVGRKINTCHAYHIISRSKQLFQGRRFPQIPFYIFLHLLHSSQLFKTLLVGTGDVVVTHAMPQDGAVPGIQRYRKGK